LKPDIKRIYKWFITLSLTGIILLAALYMFRSVLIAPYIKRFLESSIESQLGMRLKIGGIGGSYITDLSLKDVTTLQPAPSGPLAAIEMKRLEMGYNPLSFLKGLNGFLADATVVLKGAVFDIDISGQEEISTIPDEKAPLQSFFLPDTLPRIRVKDTSVYLRGPGYGTAFEGIDLETRNPRLRATDIRLRVSQWSWTHPNLQDGKAPLDVELEYSRKKITVKNLSVDNHRLTEDLQVGLESLPEILSFNAGLKLASGRVTLDGRLDQTALQTHIETDHLDLAQISSFISSPQLDLIGNVSMKADLFLPLERPIDFETDLELKLIDGNIYGIAADDLKFAADVKDGRIRLGALNLRNGPNIIEIREVKAPSATVFSGDVEALLETLEGNFSFNCRDVPSLLLQTGAISSTPIDSIPTHEVLLDGELRRGTIFLSGGSLSTADGHIRLTPSRIALPLESRPLSESPMRGTLEIDFPNLDSVGRIFAIQGLEGTLHGRATVTGTLAAPGGTAVVAADAVKFRAINYGDVRITARADTERAVIESMTLRHGEDRLTGHGTIYFETKEIEDARIELRIADLSVYEKRLWSESWNLFQQKHRIRGSLEGKAEISGPLNMPDVTVAIKARGIAVDETQFGDSTLQMHSNGRKITIDTLQMHHSEDRLDLKGTVDFASGNLEDANLQISIVDVADYTRNFLPQMQPLSGGVHGILKASGNYETPEALADFRFENLRFGEFGLPAATLKATSSDRRVFIKEADVKSPVGNVKFSADILRKPSDMAFDVHITALNVELREALLALDKPGYLSFSRHGDLSFRDISLSGPTGALRAKGAVTASGKANIEAKISNFNSRGWLDTLVTDRLVFSGLNADAHLSGPLDSPSLTVTGNLDELTGSKNRSSLAGRFDISYAKGKAVIRQFEWHGQAGNQIAMAGTIPIDIMGENVLSPGPIAVDAEIRLPDLSALESYFPDYTNTKGSLQAEMHLAGTWNAPSGTVMLKCRDFNPPAELKPMPDGPFKIDGRIRLADRNAVVESFQIDSPVAALSGSGEWTGMPALADLLRGKTDKPSGDIALTGNLSVSDLNWIAAGSPALRRVAGRLEAKITLKGPVSEPAADAVVRLTEGELRPDMALPSLQMINLEAVVSPTALNLKTFSGALGGAPFTIAGSVTRDGEGEVRTDLALRGKNLLYYRSEGLKLRADTDLTIRGPLNQMEVTGEVAITDGRLVKYFDILSTLKGSSKPETDTGLQLFSLRTPPFSDMSFDVQLTSKNPFKISNNLAKGAVRPELSLTGTGEFPVLSGEVYVDPTRINLPAGTLVFESGIVRFDPNRPDLPTVDLVGKSKMLGYDITVLVEGPYNEPVITLSSVPPLSNEELLLLLIAGQQPNSTGDAAASQRQSMNVAVFLGRDLISRWFGGESAETDESIIDRLEVGFGRELTRSGEETIDAQFRITDNVFFDGDKLYITGERDIYDFYNAGVKIVFRFK
jgi:autotransporter translocation and assembly factor TamB